MLIIGVKWWNKADIDIKMHDCYLFFKRLIQSFNLVVVFLFSSDVSFNENNVQLAYKV